METKTVEIGGKYQVQVRAPKNPTWENEGSTFGKLADALAYEAELKLKQDEQVAPTPVTAITTDVDDKRSAKERKEAAKASVSPAVAQLGEQQAENRRENQ